MSKNSKNDSERRGWERFFLRVEGGDNTCQVHDGVAREFTVLVKDISIGGVMCELVDDGQGHPELAEEQDLFFSKCTLQPWGKYMCGIRGFVRWVDGKQLGCQFYHPLGVGK